ADGEVCDDGNTNDCDACNNHCTSTNICGNGTVDTACGEVCDNGSSGPAPNNGANENCTPTCKCSTCCDGLRDTQNNNDTPQCPAGTNFATEACDDSNTVNTDGCRNNCSSTNACGNGITDTIVGENCDDGNTVSCDGCDANCKAAACGNGVTCPPEVCDDGNTVFCDGCNNLCNSNNACGNGILDGSCGETCDDGNTNNCDACSNSCKPPQCGDGAVCGAEVCDDGNTVSGDNCSANCLSNETCGNGTTDTAKGEECDQGPGVCVGGTRAGDSCCSQLGTANCYTGGGVCRRFGTGPICCDAAFAAQALAGGNAACAAGGEPTNCASCPFKPTCNPTSCSTCNDDHNANACRCSCQAAGCGDGVRDAGEQCDDVKRNDGLDDADSCPNGANTAAAGVDCRVSESCNNGIPRLVDSSANCQGGPNPPACAGFSAQNCKPGTEQCDAGGGSICVLGAPQAAGKRCLENPLQTCTSDSAGCTCGNSNTADHCRSTTSGAATQCNNPKCGDGISVSGEGCDTGASNSDT